MICDAYVCKLIYWSNAGQLECDFMIFVFILVLIICFFMSLNYLYQCWWQGILNEQLAQTTPLFLLELQDAWYLDEIQDLGEMRNGQNIIDTSQIIEIYKWITLIICK